MKTDRNILLAFILNLFFSFFEFCGGLITGSVAIISDAVHDIGDAFCIGISYFLEKKSRKKPDDKYTYGYARYSDLGGLITTLILLIGSILVLCNAIHKMIVPAEINYDGMIIFAIVGVILNFGAAYFTREGGSLNQKAVNLHMLEDVLGWLVVLVGAIVMRFTKIAFIDPLMSICVSLFVIVNAIRNLKEFAELFLERVPHNINVADLKKHIEEIDEVIDVHHIHIWKLNGHNNIATLHIISDGDPHIVKERVRAELREHRIGHATIEMEKSFERCQNKQCQYGMYSHFEHSYHMHHSHHSH